MTALLRAFTGFARKHGFKKYPREYAAFRTLGRSLPPIAVVHCAINDWTLGAGHAGDIVTWAVNELGDLSAVRDPIVDLYLGRPPTAEATSFWLDVGRTLVAPAMRDPVVVRRLVKSFLGDVSTDRTYGKRMDSTRRLLEEHDFGIIGVIARLRRQRDNADPFQLDLLHLSVARRPIVGALCTLFLELAEPGRRRDPLLEAIGEVDQPAALAMLERVLATGLHTRSVTQALRRSTHPRAVEILQSLAGHEDPMVPVLAARALAATWGRQAVPALVAAVRRAHAHGVWSAGGSIGAWFNHGLGTPADAMTLPTSDRLDLRDVELDLPPQVPGPWVSGAFERMMSPNPDVRRDAIELAHCWALSHGDGSVAVALVRAERFHAARCERAGLTDARVEPTYYWSTSEWRRRLRMQSDENEQRVWQWIERHAGAAVPQVVPPALAGIATDEGLAAALEAAPERPLSFTDEERRAWLAEEDRLIATLW